MPFVCQSQFQCQPAASDQWLTNYMQPEQSKSPHWFILFIRDFHSWEKLARPFCFLLLYCLIAGPAVPQGRPLRRILSLKGQQLHLRWASSQSCCTLSVPPLPSTLGLVTHTWHTTFLGSFFTFISSVCSLNSTCPLLALFPFFALSLFLQTPHYPLSAFLILSLISHCLSRPNLPLFTASVHLLPPFANLHFFTLLTSVKPHIVSLSGVLPSNEKMQEINWLIAEWMWRISPLF